jgi:hypothetical protein
MGYLSPRFYYHICMKFKRAFFLSLSLACLLYFPASAQNDLAVLNQIMAKCAKLYTSYPIERTYLQFDKPYYALGDTIWFKAYVTVDRHVPSPLSKIVYVDILGPRDSLMQSLKLQVKNSVASSSIPISQYAYKKGNYRVIAYTNWMNNAGPEYFFNKNITIGDAINNDVSTQVSLKSTVFNKLPKISAAVYFKDDDGNPYSEKRVSWSVIKDEDAVIKGKGETDKNGFINISFVNNKNYSLDSASLITSIENSSKRPVYTRFPLKSIAKPNDIQFFPEGGELLVGVRTKVAFKAVKSDGLGIDVKGVVTDNDNNVVTEFSSGHLGMGVFVLLPEDGKTYKVKVTFADGSTASPDLPKIQANGINLSLENNSPDILGLRLQADQIFFNEYKDKTLFIIAKSEGVICFAAKTVLSSQVYSANIPKSKFPTGIVQVTLFTADGEPLSERIAFIQHNDQLKLSVTGDQPAYSTRQKVKLNITAKNGALPDEGNFSITVLDESKVPFDDDSETTILTYLLLTSDIKGYIEKPNYYFNHADEKAAADLDVLMQTQGYRRFSYDGILNNKYPAINFLPESGISIGGTLRAMNGLAINHGNISISIPDKNYYKSTFTNADGRFVFTDLMFLDSAKVKLSARDNVHGNDLILNIDGDPSQRIGPNYNAPDEIINIDSALSAYLKNSKAQFKNGNVLKEVVIRDTKIVNKVSHKDYSSLSSLSSEPDHLINGSQFAGCGSVLECLKGFVIGMTYDNGKFYVSRGYNSGSKVPVQIFVKGMPVDADFLSTLNATDIESVELFLKDELGLINSAYGTNGAIVVNVKKAPVGEKMTYQQLKNLIPQRNELTFNPKGYTPVKTFYIPRYSGPKANQPLKADTRTTIYWNPNVITDKTGAASVEYFNSDGKGTCRAIIEGIDNDGNIGRLVYRYTVK